MLTLGAISGVCLVVLLLVCWFILLGFGGVLLGILFCFVFSYCCCFVLLLLFCLGFS